MKKKRFKEVVTDPTLIAAIDAKGLIQDQKRKHRMDNVNNEENPRFKEEWTPKLSLGERQIVDLAIDTALANYAYDYKKLPEGDGRDERRRLKSMLSNGLEAVKYLGDSKTASSIEKHIQDLPELILTKGEVLSQVRESMGITTRLLGKSLFDKIAKQMIEIFEDEFEDYLKKVSESDELILDEEEEDFFTYKTEK